MSERRQRRRTSIATELVEDAGSWGFLDDPKSLVEAAAAEIATEPGLVTAAAAVTVVLSDDASVAILNGQYRGKPKPTNVLSFPAGPGAEAGHIGDIVLACETVVREAGEEDVSAEHHFSHLVVHGILHLLGLDHETQTDAEGMEALEVRILDRLGIANPYTAPLDAAKN